MSTHDEAVTLMNELGMKALAPHAKKLYRIALAGDVAVVFFDADPTEADILHERLRGGQTGPVVQLTRTRAARELRGLAMPLYRWLTSKAPAGHSKVYLLAGRAALQVNRAPGRTWLEPGTATDESLIELLT